MSTFISRAFLLSITTLALLPAAALADEPILPLSEVTPGMSCTAKTVFSGETPTSFPVTVRDIYRDPQYGDYLLVEVGGAAASTGIAQGMSGSPVYCPSPNGPAIAGALSYGLGWENDQVGLATPIETMLGELPSSNSGAQAMPRSVRSAAAKRQALPIPFVATGLPQEVLNVARKRNPKASILGSTQTAEAPSKRARSASSEMNPGDSMGLTLASGDWSFGGIGTVSYKQGSRIWAFGHPFLDVGDSNLFLTRAPITTIVDADPSGANYTPSYKLGTIGSPVGTIDNDSANSISGTLGGLPSAPTAQVSKVQGRTSQRVAANIANESGQGWPHLGDLNQVLAGGSLLTAAYKALGKNWVSNFSSRTCWKVTVAGIEEPFRVCRQVVSRKPYDPFYQVPGFAEALVDPEYSVAAAIGNAAYRDLNITEMRSDATVSNNLQAAQITKARQVGKTRRGVARVRVTYLNRANGKTEQSDLRLRVGSRSKGRTVRIEGLVGSLPVDASITNQPAGATDADGYPIIPSGATSEEELRQQIEDLDGSTMVSIKGLRGGARSIPFKVNKLLPLGEASFRVR